MNSMKETGVNDLGEIFSKFLKETFCPAGLPYRRNTVPIISLPYLTVRYDASQVPGTVVVRTVLQ